MARRDLGPAALAVAQAVGAGLPRTEFVVGCSGGADSLALALGAQWAAARVGLPWSAVVIDHGLQPGSDEVASLVVARLAERGIDARAARVQLSPGAMEAGARDARLAALSSAGRPVLLGHTLDDQAETVMLGLSRGSGTRSLAGMAPRRGPFVRPLLGLRRATTEQACREWGIETWDDPHNREERFARVRVRRSVLPMLERELGPGVAEALARTAELARADADMLDAIAASVERETDLDARSLATQEPALRWRVLLAWLRERGAADVSFENVRAVDALVVDWRGQKGIDVAGLRVVRDDGRLFAGRGHL